VIDHAPLLAIALGLDALFGEPDVVWSRVPHPAVLMGRLVGWFDRTLNTGQSRRAKGILAVVALSAVAIALGWVFRSLPGGPVFEVLIAAVLLAQKSLVDHVRAVADGLRRSLEMDAAPFR
jgi:adenosylcobinamide-phosphate synthase